MAKTGEGPREQPERAGDMSVRDAGRKGGEVRKGQLGREGYAQLGRKGGEAVARSRGRGFYEEIGHKGGEARKEQLGPGGYRELGRRGGEARRRQLGPGGYAELGHRGGQRVKALIEQGKQALAGGPTAESETEGRMAMKERKRPSVEHKKSGNVPFEEPLGAESGGGWAGGESEGASEAVGISAVAREIEGIDFPIRTSDLLGRIGARVIEVSRGRMMSFADLLGDYEGESFESKTDLLSHVKDRISVLGREGREAEIGRRGREGRESALGL